jgi:ribosomal protein S18 acetylase RimI-like enzyme
MGLRKVFLTTEFSNHRAISLFRKLSFRIKSTYGEGCEMRLDLPAAFAAQAA